MKIRPTYLLVGIGVAVLLVGGTGITVSGIGSESEAKPAMLDLESAALALPQPLDSSTPQSNESKSTSLSGPILMTASGSKRCGTYTYSSTGTVGTVVARGDVSCKTARSVLHGYFSLPDSALGGNAQHGDVGVWHCSSPTAGTSQMTGVGTQCTRPNGDQIVIRVH